MLIDMDTWEDFFEEVFDADPVVLRLLPAPLKPIYGGYVAADVIGTYLAEKTIQAGGVGALDLYTPEIRRYEETALVGMGGMII